jgi:hypothetical protein
VKLIFNARQLHNVLTADCLDERQAIVCSSANSLAPPHSLCSDGH